MLGQYEALVSFLKSGSVSGKALQGFAEITDIVVTFNKQAEVMPVAELIDKLIKRIGYFHYLDDGTPQGESRIENVRELISVAKGYTDSNLAAFLEEVSLVSDTDNEGKVDNAVTLMTLHSAKGLEFPVVYMVGMEEGIFPHSRALFDQKEMEEERRLAYVGMTRAREELNLVYATSRVLYGAVQYNPPSQFIKDVDGHHDEPVMFAPLGAPQIDGNEPRYVPDIDVGDGVRHPVFGVGAVVALHGDNADIMFEKRGMKKLNIAFAPLEKLS